MSCSSTISRYRQSSSVTSPVKISDELNSSFAEDCALDAIAKEAEVRLQHQREHNREARQIRQKQLSQTSHDDNDDYELSPIILPKVSEGNSTLLQKFLNGDVDLRSIEQRDLKRLLSELESKYTSLMVVNSSMFNEKQALQYQIEYYKDLRDEHDQSYQQIKRQLKEKCRDLDLQKRLLIEIEQNYKRLKDFLINCENLIEESEKNAMDDNFFLPQSLDEKLKRILQEKHEQSLEILQLKSDLLTLKTRSKSPEDLPLPLDNPSIDQQKQHLREIHDLTTRLDKVEGDYLSSQQENKRYEAQLTRYKQELNDAERVEEELKQERRKFQRELRTIRDELENERTRNDVLQCENTRLRKKNLIVNSDDELLLLNNHFQTISHLDHSN